MVYKLMLWLLILYDGSSNSNNDRGMRGGGVGGADCWAKRANSVLDPVFDSYSDSDIFLYMY